MLAIVVASSYLVGGLGCVLLMGLIVLRAAFTSGTRGLALRRGCICPVAVRRSRFNTRDGFRYYKPACPVHGGAARRLVDHATPTAFALCAAVLALVLLLLGLR